MPRFLEQVQVVSAIAPLDLQTARDGDWVSLKNYKCCAIIFHKGAGTAGDDPVFRLQQATDIAGAGAKDLSFGDFWKKQGTLTSVGVWTKVVHAAAASATGDATSAEDQALYAIEINADELDVDGGFDCLRFRVDDTGVNAQLGSAEYHLFEPRYPDSPENMLSAIVN